MHLYVTFYMLTTEKYILLLDVMCWCFTAIVYNTVVTLFTYIFLIDDIKCFDITGRIRKTLADSQLKTGQLICKLCSLLLRARKFCCPIQWTKKKCKNGKKKTISFSTAYKSYTFPHLLFKMKIYSESIVYTLNFVCNKNTNIYFLLLFN